MDPTQPEEDIELLMKTFIDPLVMFLRPDAKEYFEWFLNANAKPFYEEEKRYLQLLGWKNPPSGHWIMKGPFNTIFLDTLMTVFPDANFVWMHRRVTEVIPSSCSLIKNLAALYRPWVDKREIGQATLAGLKLSLERGMAARNTRVEEETNVTDIHYETLMKDPIAAVKNIYQQFGYTYTQEFEDKMKKWLAENPQRKYGEHRYTLEEYGLDKKQVEESFETYTARFNVAI